MASKRISKELQVRLQALLRAGREVANQPALSPVPSQPGRSLATALQLFSSLLNLAAARPAAISC